MQRALIIIGVLCLLLVATVMALRSQQVVLSVAHWAFDTFTDLRLEIRNPRIDVFAGTLAADEVHILTENASAPALLSIINLQGERVFRPFFLQGFSKTSLEASQLLIYVSERDGTRNPTPLQWMDLLIWIPESLRIAQTRIIRATDRTQVIPLYDLQGQYLENGRYAVIARSDFKEAPILFELDSSRLESGDRTAELTVKARLWAPDSGDEINLEGSLRTTDQRFSYDFLANGRYPDINNFLRAFNASASLEGALTMEARVRGNTRGLVLSDISMVLDNMPAYGFEAAGEIAYDFDGISGIRLAASGEMASMDYLVDWLDFDLQQLGRAQAGLKLSGSLDSPIIDQFVVTTLSADGLALQVSGSMDFGGNRHSARPANEIRVDAQGPTLDVLTPWLGKPRIEPGAWRASWRAAGTADEVTISQLVMEVGTPATYEIRLQGSIDRIANPGSAGLASVQGVALQVSAATSDSAKLSTLFDVQLPPHQAVTGSADLAGSGDELVLSNGSFHAQSSDLSAHLSSLQAVVHPGAEKWISELSANIALSASDTSVLSQFSAWETPVLGPLEVTGKVRLEAGQLNLEHLFASVRGEGFTLESQGTISSLLDERTVRLQNTLTAVESRRVLEYVLPDFSYQGNTGQFEGAFQLSNSAGKWQVSGLDLRTIGEPGPLQFSLRGDIADLTGFTRANLDATFGVSDVELWQAMSGLRIQPAQGNLKIRSSPGGLQLVGQASFGTTLLTSDIFTARRNNELQELRVTLHTPQLNLADLGLQRERRQDENYVPANQLDKYKPVADLPQFLASLPRFPLDVSFVAEGITGHATNIDSLNLQLTGADELYTLRRLSIGYDGANAEIRGLIDLQSQPPAFTLAGEVVSVPMDILSRDLGIERDITGTLTARGGVTARGVTGQSLVRTLDGNLSIALEHTEIKGAAYDVLATDFLAWIYSGAIMDDATHVDCAMARFDFSGGVAQTDSLYIETQRMIATGEARFNLGDKTMDLTLVPRSRSRAIQIPSRIRLTGDISDPRATVSPLSAAADASAEALLVIPKLVMKVFGSHKGASSKGVQPCLAGNSQ